MPNNSNRSWEDSYSVRNFEQMFRAQLDAMEKSGKELVREHRHNTAKVLLSAGLRLIPSQYLDDDQFVVSQGVYDAAKRIVEGRSG